VSQPTLHCEAPQPRERGVPAVSQEVDQRFFFTVGRARHAPLRRERDVPGPERVRFVASINNVSFVLPTRALLQSHFTAKSQGVYVRVQLPGLPAHAVSSTTPAHTPPNNTNVMNGTKVVVLPFNTNVWSW
jgi:laccase